MPRGVYPRDVQGDNNPNWRGGKSSHPLYHLYHDMRRRCTHPGHKRYADYGGRGIRVCDAWLEDFWQFVADVGERPEGKTRGGRAYWQLDRIDNDGNYDPGNVRWASPSQQASNQRIRSRHTVCRRQHPMTVENTYVYPSGDTRCRECSRINEYNRTRSRERREHV